MSSNNIIDIDQSDFEKKVIEQSEQKLIIVDFWAPWCGPCKQLTPIMEKVAKENSDAFELVKINIDENSEIASQLRIQSIPTVYAFKDKKIVNAFQGVISEKDFIDFIEKSAGKKLTEHMTKKTIRRWVWNLTTISNLSNHPNENRPEITDFESLYFRLETQISAPLDNKSSLFLVKVEVFPLKEVWDEIILESINSMSENILHYKKLIKIKKFLNS